MADQRVSIDNLFRRLLFLAIVWFSPAVAIAQQGTARPSTEPSSLAEENDRLQRENAALRAEVARLRIKLGDTPKADHAESADAAKPIAIFRAGDMEARILSYGIGPVRVDGLTGVSTTRDRFLWIKVRVANLSASKKADYFTWRGDGFDSRHQARVTDANGNEYRSEFKSDSFTDLTDGKNYADIYPGKSTEDLLVFQQPIDGVKSVNIDLPLSAIGAEDAAIKTISLPLPHRSRGSEGK